MEFLHDTYTWVTFSFIVFAVVAFKFGRKAVLSALDTRIATIRAEIDTAERLRAEAQALVLEFEQRQKDAQREADKMVATARDQAEALRVREEARLEDTMRRKEEQLNARLTLMRDQAIDEIRQVAATLAFDAAEKMVTQKMDADTRAKLIERALDQVAQRLN
jgi:F-type H+-transporting ATPase subunit b